MPTDPPAPDPGAAALAEQIAKLRETLGEFQRVLGEQRGDLAALGQRMDDAQVDQLAARFAKLTQTVSDAIDAAAPKGPALPRWDQITGDARLLELGRVRKWVARVLRPLYIEPGDAGYWLPECWHQHPPVVMELSWVSIYWRYIWDRPRPGTIKDAAEWHDRWLPGAMRRIGPMLEPCKHIHNGTRIPGRAP